MNKGPHIDRKEWYFVFAVAAGILLLTSLPYVYAATTTPPDKVYTGMMLDVPDHLQYFSWMRELTDANLAANKLTPEPNEPVFFNLLWWGLGRISRLIGVGYAGTFQILRVFSTLLFLAAVYRLLAYVLPLRKERLFAFLLVCFTSGFGWVLVVLKYTLTKGELLYPLDVYIAEANTFLCILGYPHFIAALLYIVTFDLIFIAERTKRYRYAVLAGLVALFLGWQHAYDLITIYGILGAYGILQWYRDRRLPSFLLKSGVILGLISWWPALYSVLLTRLDPIWKAVLEQFDNAGVFTPNLLHLPILLGLSFILALVVGIVRNPVRLRTFSDVDLFFIGWFWISFILVYLPVDYQIHLLNGWQIPIAYLATRGVFDYILPYVSRLKIFNKIRRRESIILAILFLSVIPTNVYLFFWRFIELSRHDYPYYLSTSEMDGLNWLDSHGEESDVVLSSLTIGQYIPAYTGKYAYLAHWAQTVDFFTKRDAVEEFFSDNTGDERRRQILSEKGVDFVFYGPAEKLLGSFEPAGRDYLVRVFEAGEVEIFQVKLE